MCLTCASSRWQQGYQPAGAQCLHESRTVVSTIRNRPNPGSQMHHFTDEMLDAGSLATCPVGISSMDGGGGGPVIEQFQLPLMTPASHMGTTGSPGWVLHFQSSSLLACPGKQQQRMAQGHESLYPRGGPGRSPWLLSCGARATAIPCPLYLSHR